MKSLKKVKVEPYFKVNGNPNFRWGICIFDFSPQKSILVPFMVFYFRGPISRPTGVSNLILVLFDSVFINLIMRDMTKFFLILVKQFNFYTRDQYLIQPVIRKKLKEKPSIQNQHFYHLKKKIQDDVLVHRSLLIPNVSHETYQISIRN